MKKVTFVDLGFILGRFTLDGIDDQNITLDVIRPEISEVGMPQIPAASIAIVGRESLAALREAITQTLDDLEKIKQEWEGKYGKGAHPDCPF